MNKVVEYRTLADLPWTKQQYKIYGKPVTWKDAEGLIHACAGTRLPECENALLWTFCSIDVPRTQNSDLIRIKKVTCLRCLQDLG